MDIIVEELKNYGINMEKDILEIAIEKCILTHGGLLHDMVGYYDFNEENLETTYNAMGRYDLGQIIAFYSLIEVLYKETKKGEKDKDLIKRLTRITVDDLKKSNKDILRFFKEKKTTK